MEGYIYLLILLCGLIIFGGIFRKETFSISLRKNDKNMYSQDIILSNDIMKGENETVNDEDTSYQQRLSMGPGSCAQNSVTDDSTCYATEYIPAKGTTINVNNPTGIVVGTILRIYNFNNDYEEVAVAAVNGNAIELTCPLTNNYFRGNKVRIINSPNVKNRPAQYVPSCYPDKIIDGTPIDNKNFKTHKSGRYDVVKCYNACKNNTKCNSYVITQQEGNDYYNCGMYIEDEGVQCESTTNNTCTGYMSDTNNKRYNIHNSDLYNCKNIKSPASSSPVAPDIPACPQDSINSCNSFKNSDGYACWNQDAGVCGADMITDSAGDSCGNGLSKCKVDA